jgi:ferredoxin
MSTETTHEDYLGDADTMLALLGERLCAAEWPDFTDVGQRGLACFLRAIRRNIAEGMKEQEALASQIKALTEDASA